jgi:hypothetical protein
VGIPLKTAAYLNFWSTIKKVGKPVIASEAKQSLRGKQLIIGDCFVASLLAMTAWAALGEVILLRIKPGRNIIGVGQIADAHDQDKKDPEDDGNNQPVLGGVLGFSVSGVLIHRNVSLPSRGYDRPPAGLSIFYCDQGPQGICIITKNKVLTKGYLASQGVIPDYPRQQGETDHDPKKIRVRF